MPTVKTPAPPNPAQARHCFGSHLSVAGGVHRALEEAFRLWLDTVQVFVKNQRQWSGPPLAADDVARWHALRTRPGFGPVVAHASYLINLATPDRALRKRSRAAFADELHRCDRLAISYLVVHPGAATDGKVTRAVSRVADSLNWILGENGELRAMPLLETTAGQGTTLGRSFDELGAIVADLEQPERVGVCLDTCHLFAAGYDLRTAEGYAQMIEAASTTVGIERIRCVHLNDSRGDCGSRLDRHEHIGRGRLGTVGFAHLLADRRFVGVPMILETPKGEDERGRNMDLINLRRLRTIATRAGRAATAGEARRGAEGALSQLL